MANRRGIATTGSRFAVTVLLLLGLVGCGSGSSDAEPEGEALTRAEFIEQANVICERNNEVLRAAVIESFGPDEQPDDDAGIRFTHEIWVPNLREQNRELTELGKPPADRQRIEAMLDSIERVTDQIEADPALASEGPFDEVTRELTDYGIGHCGSP